MHGAKETLAKFTREMEGSSEQALALKNTDFQVPPVFAEPKDIRIQLKEIRGLATEFHNTEYAKLIGVITPIRKEWGKTKDLEGRKQMAKEEFDAWNGYLEARKSDLPKPDFVIDDKDLSLLRDNFDRFKDRKTHAVKSGDLVDFHHDFTKKFKFRVPLHPKNMQQMIHPHFGYLASFKNRDFNFN